MDSALLTEALDSLELLQSVIEHFPEELIEAELALLPQSQQLRFQQLSNRLRVQDLAQRVRCCTTWEEIELVITQAKDCQQEIWALLSDEEKERIKNLKAAAAKLLDSNCSSLVGKRVYVTPGDYCTGGEGVVEADRGYGSLRLIEVRMPNSKIQIVQLTQVRLPR
jgi:hypothetical protein